MKKGFPNRHLKELPHYKHLHSVWATMRTRGTNPNSERYSRYGGRGIKVCSEWEYDFLNFYNWAVNREDYSEDLQIDRIDNDGDYCPENCQWVTLKENTKKRSTSVLLTVRGITKNASVWSEELNVNLNTLYWWCRDKGIEYAESCLGAIMLGGV